MGKRLTMGLAAAMVCCALALAACGKQGELRSIKARLAPSAPWADVNALAEGNGAFALDLYQRLSAEEGNLIYSPYSLSLALAMVYGGARGETAQQMAAALHFDLPQERLHQAFNALDQDLAGRSQPPVEEEDSEGVTIATEGFTLNIANAVWGQAGYPYEAAYLDLLAEAYGAGMRVADFERAPEQAVQAINGWAAEATEGRIPQVVGDLSTDTRLVAANAIYFHARWDEGFDATATMTEAFHLVDGGEVETPLMHQEESFAYAEGDGWQAAELPYEGGGFSMVILLPREGRYREIEAQLTGERVAEIVKGLVQHRLALTMPKFSFEPPAIGLAGVLEGMGMRDAFTPGAADFGGIAARDLVLSEIVQKALIEVDEEGTEAAAVTVVIMVEVSKPIVVEEEPPIEMRADRPFVFLIRDRETGAILFVGRVMDPTQG